MTGPIAFLGTGLMGAPMARNLSKGGLKIRAWNRSRQKVEALGGDVQVAGTPAQACRDAEACVVMQSSGPVCREVLFASDGAVHTLAPGALLVVMSSIGYDEARGMAQEASSLGLRWLDAPVSGGTKGAEEARLSIMVGGEPRDFEAAKPMLDAMGSPVLVGPAGTGALTKLVNQITVAATIATVSEALLLAEAGGADLSKVRQALLGGFANSTILEQHGLRMIEGRFEPGGPARYQVKDTTAARAAAGDLGLTLPVLDLVDTLFADLVAHGDGDLDHSALLREMRRRNGRPV